MTEQFENKIKEIVDSMTTASFNYVFSTKRGANYVLGNTPMPAVVNVIPVSGNLKVKPTTISSSPNCLIGFFDKLTEVTDDAVLEREAAEINTRMFLAAQEFIVKANASGYFQLITDVPYQNIEEYDIRCFGIVLDIQLAEKLGNLICSLK